MAPRVAADDVKEILDANQNTHDIAASITAANTIVNRITGLPESELTEIERWLAAHFVAIYNPVTQQRSSFGDTVTDYARGTLGKGLDFTPYGQQAKILDRTGTLAEMEREATHKKPEFCAMG